MINCVGRGGRSVSPPNEKKKMFQPYKKEQRFQIKFKKSKLIGPQDFTALRELGRGSFGQVYLVEKNDSGVLFAMKIMHKHEVVQKNLIRYAMT